MRKEKGQKFITKLQIPVKKEKKKMKENIQRIER